MSRVAKGWRILQKLDHSRLDDFLSVISKGRTVIAPEKSSTPSPSAGSTDAKDRYHLTRSESWQAGRHTLAPYRPVEPLKALVFPPLERVGFLTGGADVPETEPRIVIGVKNCDLSALRIHDHVFLNTEPVDPFYAEARSKTIIVSCDCTDARDVCFCPAVKEQPYAKGGYDINLSPTAKGIVVEAGSERGEALLEQASDLLQPADEALIVERDRARDEMTQRVAEQAKAKGLTADADLQAAIKGTQDADLWDVFARDCVECGACNFACCTCHCFLLADGRTPEGTARVKQWDSCLYRNFARVAGGANPRKHRAERLYNRFDKKFNFFPNILGTYACDGCGRCIEACTGKIDIRDVLKRALDER